MPIDLLAASLFEPQGMLVEHSKVELQRAQMLASVHCTVMV